MPEEGINDLPDWEALWAAPGAVIEDEYGKKLTPEEMKSWIAERSREKWEEKPDGYGSWEAFHRDNGSIAGPNNLLRHKLSRLCVGHGAGTWDLLVGEFS